jgi:DnaJ-class molecular chaperone
MVNGGQEILSQLFNQTNNSNLVGKETMETDDHLKQNLTQPSIFLKSSNCPACGGTGDWKSQISKTITKIIKCKRCVNGFIPVPCNNCIDGWSEIGPCRTCHGTGIYVYYPTDRYPEGKVCRFCLGTTKIIRKKVITIPKIQCLKCKGTGILQQSKSFNPVIKEKDIALIKMIDKMTSVLFESKNPDESIEESLVA